MQAKVQRWGNSLAVRIPKSFAAQSKLAPETPIELSIEGEVITVRALKPRRYMLEELLEGVTEENRHEEISTGNPVGKEVW